MGKLFTNLKKRVAILTILCMMLTLAPSTAFAATASDITGHWAQNTIQAWIDQGTIKGYPDGTFRPENNISRAEFMTLVNGFFGYTEMTAITYTDVSTNAWYANAVAKASAAGYINGYPDGTMRPENLISREEVASIIMKINKLVANEAGANNFSDANTLVWSKGAVGACYLAGILNGYPDGSFKGKDYIKRGEAVFGLNKSSKYIAPVAVVTPPAVSTGGGGNGNGGGGDNGPASAPNLTSITVTPLEGGDGTTSGSAYRINEGTTAGAAHITLLIEDIEDSRTYNVTMTIKNEDGSVRATASASGLGSLINDYLNDKDLSITDLTDALALLSDEDSKPDNVTTEPDLTAIYNQMTKDEVYEMTVTITPVGFSAKADAEIIYLMKVK